MTPPSDAGTRPPSRGRPRYHRDAFVAYQIERAVGLGTLSTELARRGGEAVAGPGDAPAVFGALADEAERDGRWPDAVGCARLAEFFTPRPSPAQVAAYERYVRLWDRAFGGDAVRHEVAYEAGRLPVLHRPARGRRLGAVVAFGGFDSLVEEFDPIWRAVAAAGFDLFAFDGPGQGGARTRFGLTHTHDWERPVAAVLDHFGLERVALVGMSMGGYWAIRAASREPRVAAAVAWPPVYDWLARLPAPVGAFVRRMATWRRFMNATVRLRARLIPVLAHVVAQATWISGGREPVDAVAWLLGMNAEHVGSERVTAPTLLFVGERDRFQPPVLADLQARALSSAPVTVRRFSVAEGAAGHCQLTNLPLATEELAGWLRRTLAPAAADPGAASGPRAGAR
jgi:pimeloyl-ACP methyl ester carboxylesterase